MEIKDRILKACRELARIKGFYNMNMDELARQTGVSKRTIYRYFRSKEEIIEASLDAFMAEMAGRMEETMARDLSAPEMITAIIGNLVTHGQFLMSPIVLNDLRVHYPHLWNKINTFRLARARAAINRYMQLSSNPVLQEIDPRIVTAIILTSIQEILNPGFILDNGLTFESTAGQLSKFFMTVFA